MADIAAAMADDEVAKAEIIEDEGKGRLIVITAEPEAMLVLGEATAVAEAQPETLSENCELAKKNARKGKGKKGAASTVDAGK